MDESSSVWTKNDYKAFAQHMEPAKNNVDYASMRASRCLRERMRARTRTRARPALRRAP